MADASPSPRFAATARRLGRARPFAFAAAVLVLGCRGGKVEDATYAGHASGSYAPPPASSGRTPIEIDTRVTVTGGDPKVVILGCAVETSVVRLTPSVLASSGERAVPDCTVDLAGRGPVRLRNIALQIELTPSRDEATITMTATGPEVSARPDFTLTFRGKRLPK